MMMLGDVTHNESAQSYVVFHHSLFASVLRKRLSCYNNYVLNEDDRRQKNLFARHEKAGKIFQFLNSRRQQAESSFEGVLGEIHWKRGLSLEVLSCKTISSLVSRVAFWSFLDNQK